MKFTHVALLTLAGFAGAAPAAADSISLPAAYRAGFINAQYFQTGLGLVTLGSDHIDNIPAQFLSGSDLSSASAGYTTSLAPSVIVQGTAIKSDSDPAHTAIAYTGIDLYYYFYIAGPVGVTVPVNVVAQAQVTGAYTGSITTNYVDSLVGFAIESQDGSSVLLLQQQGTSFSSDDTIPLISGEIYLVNMFASVQAITRGPGRASGEASMDPVLTIGPGFDQFQLDFSDGIANAEVSETPLPATLPLFVSGLGAIGVIGWRRKRMNAAAV